MKFRDFEFDIPTAKIINLTKQVEQNLETQRFNSIAVSRRLSCVRNAKTNRSTFL